MIDLDSIISIFTGRKVLLTGVDIGTSGIKVSRLRESRGGHSIIGYGALAYPEPYIVGTEIIDFISLSSSIKTAVETYIPHPTPVAVQIPLSLCFYTVVSASPTEDPDSVVSEHIKGILPESEIDKINIKYTVLPVSIAEGHVDIAIAAVKRDVVEEYVSLVKGAGLEVGAVDIEPAALANQFYLNYPDKLPECSCIVDIGASFTKIVVAYGGYPYITRNVEIGGNTISEQLQKEFLISAEEAEQLKMGEDVSSVSYAEAFDKVISKILRKLATEIVWAMDNFKERFEKEVESIYLFGGGANQKGAVEIFKNTLNKTVVRGEPFLFAGEEGKSEFAIAVGLSLRYKGDENAKV